MVKLAIAKRLDSASEKKRREFPSRTDHQNLRHNATNASRRVVASSTRDCFDLKYRETTSCLEHKQYDAHDPKKQEP